MSNSNEAANQIASIIGNMVNTDQIMKEVNEKVDKRLEGIVIPKPIIIKMDNKKQKKLEGLYHKDFPSVLRAVKSKQNTALIGDTGSGKTFMCEQAADALDIPFYFNGTTAQEYKLFGFIDANGKYNETPFYKAFTEGGLYLADEFDSWCPNVSLTLNAALSNKICDFPNGVVKAHEDFRFIASLNTWGKGATREFVGRNAMDAASMARLSVQIIIEYDEDLERQFAPNAEFCEFVISARHAINELGIRHIVSPRVSIAGGAMLAAGENRTNTEKMCIWQGLESSDVSKIKRVMKKHGKEKSPADDLSGASLEANELPDDLQF